MSVLVYGIVINKRFYSENMEVDVNVANGFYCIDVASNEYLDSIEPADLIEFGRFVKKSKKMFFVSGFSFLDAFIPADIIKWQKKFKVPIKIGNNVADEWETIKVLSIPHKGVFVYFESTFGTLQGTLFTLKEIFENNGTLQGAKNLTPEMRILFQLHGIEKIRKEQELQKLKIEEFKKTVEGRLKWTIENAGGRLISYKVRRGRGFEVVWEAQGEKINTLINDSFRVVEAGFCVSGYDNTQSMGSVVNLLHRYKDDGDYIHKTRYED